jgi:hypothetical protein
MPSVGAVGSNLDICICIFTFVLHVASMSQYLKYADVRETRIAGGFSWNVARAAGSRRRCRVKRYRMNPAVCMLGSQVGQV